MYTKYNTFNEKNLLNRAGNELVVYYDTKHKLFTTRSYDACRVPKHFVQTPYAEEAKRPGMKMFWQMLDDEHRSLAESFEEKRGFFQFMRETGLIDYYDEAFAQVAEEIICDWERENHLKLDWDNINVEWCF